MRNKSLRRATTCPSPYGKGVSEPGLDLGLPVLRSVLVFFFHGTILQDNFEFMVELMIRSPRHRVTELCPLNHAYAKRVQPVLVVTIEVVLLLSYYGGETPEGSFYLISESKLGAVCPLLQRTLRFDRCLFFLRSLRYSWEYWEGELNEPSGIVVVGGPHSRLGQYARESFYNIRKVKDETNF